MIDLDFLNRRFGLILVIILVAMLFHVGGWGPLETSEARYAQIGKEMAISGDVIHPRLLGIQHFHKPPVTYMITAAGIKLWGANPFGVRFFLQVAFVLQLLMVFLLGKLILKDRNKAMIGALIYGSMPLVLMSIRNLTTDAYLNSYEILSMLMIAYYYSKHKIQYLYLSVTALALTLLTKGPVGLIVPLLMIFPIKKILSTRKEQWSVHHLLAISLFLLAGFSWFIYLMIEDTRFFNYFFLKHTVERYANASTFSRSEPWWYYLVYLTGACFPWTVLFMAKGKQAIRKKISEFPTNWMLFGIIIPFLFFTSASSKLLLYVLPLTAPIAILSSHLFFRLSDRGQLKWSVALGSFHLLAASAFILIPVFDSKAVFSSVVIVFMMVWIGFILFILIKKSAPVQIAFLSLGIILIAGPGSTFFFEHNANVNNGTDEVSRFIQEKNLEKGNIIIYNRLLPSLAFNLDKELIFVNNGEFLLQRETLFEKDLSWKKNLIDFNNEAEIKYLNGLLDEPSIMIVYKKIREENAQWLKNKFANQEMIGKYIIYYN